MNLSKNASSILNYLTEHRDDGIPPTVREICRALSIKSTSTVHKCLLELEQKGYIVKSPGLNRSLRLTGTTAPMRIPLVGTVTAGQPILAVENVEQYIPFHAQGHSASELFALRVRGESMINAGIFDGDIIVAKRTSYAANGEIVVALIEDEATVKTFYKEYGQYRLQPENDTMEPIIVDELSVLGKVIALIRYF